MNLLRKNSFIVINIVVVLLLFSLPYYLFGGKLFLGGDDTRLFYIYPKDYLVNVPFFSWTNLSSIGWSFSYQTFIPFVSVWVILSEVIRNKIILGYFSFSLPLVLGFVFFQEFTRELIIENKDKYKPEILAGALFYTLSPIIINNHFLNPLIPIWLIGLIPALCCYFLRFLKTGEYKNVFISIILTTIFSFGSHNIPWLAGFLMPLVLSLVVCSVLFSKHDVYTFIKRIAIFSTITLVSQAFWLFGFVITFINPSSSNVASKVVSGSFVNDFARSVEATSVGTIIYPLLNLYQRQIAFDFGWNLKNIYQLFYDKIYFLNVIYIAILFSGILNLAKNTSRLERKIFLILLSAFIIALFLFTINIGSLFNFYIWLGHIPGFVLFRNPYDKFALGYGLIYSLLITYCLIILNRKYKKINFTGLSIVVAFFVVVMINALPTRAIIVSPLWTTKNIYKNIIIPKEYFDFMTQIKTKISPSNNILSLPYGLSLYTIIKDQSSNNVYAGVSPVVMFSGVNDISGYLSFNYTPEATAFDRAIVGRDYNGMNNILYTHNINYVFLTKNIPEEVKKSYLFVPEVMKNQDGEFLSKITSKKIITSTEGNYELYEAKKRNLQIASDNSLFKRVSRVRYEILIKNIKSRQELDFNDTFHEGWKLYLQRGAFNCQDPKKITELKTVECQPDPKMFEPSDLTYLWQKSVFDKSHSIKNGFSNKWVIDPVFIKRSVDKKLYTLNKDGSIDLRLTLYFEPQEYFYIGGLISILTIGSLFIFVVFRRK